MSLENERIAQELIFYESYHHNKYNKLVHIFCIQLLVYTGMIILYNINPYLSYIGIFGYSAYYLFLDKISGVVYTIILSCMFYTINYISVSYAIFLHVLSWIIQILSHKYIEKRAPALLDGIVSAFSIAPLYSLLEVMYIFGYKKKFMSYISNEGGVLSNNYHNKK